MRNCRLILLLFLSMGVVLPVSAAPKKKPKVKTYRLWPPGNGGISSVFAQTSSYMRYQFQPGVYGVDAYGFVLPEDMSGKGKEHVSHIWLEGVGKGRAIGICEDPTNAWFFLENVSDVVIRRLTIRYRRRKGKKGAPCQSHALRIKRAKRVWIDRIVIDSPCPVGIFIEQSQDVVISRVQFAKGTQVSVLARQTKRLWLHKNKVHSKTSALLCVGCTSSSKVAPPGKWSYAKKVAKKLK